VLALAGADPASLKWRWMGTGVRYAYLAGDDREGRVGLMRIAPGTRLPRHGHTGEEFTMVLSGGYCDDSGHFARGDVEWADDDTVHQPRADREGECLCLVVTTGTLKAKGWLAPLLQPLMAI
jgi:putative transcriptional regulator